MSALNDRLNALLAKKAEQDLLNAAKSNDNPSETIVDTGDDWLESGKAAGSKTVLTWDTKVRVVDLYKLV